MLRRALNETSERPRIRPLVSFAFSASERACIANLIGHKLAHIEREFILQTLKHNQGNRTHAASVLGISIRSLRDKIRIYKGRGESVPEPGSALMECLEEIGEIWREVSKESDTKR